MKKNELIALFVAFLACIIWSGNFVIAQGVHEWITPITLAFCRWLVAFIFILPFGYSRVRKEWTIICDHWKYLLALGIIGIGLYNSLLYFSGHYTSSHHMAIISSTAPIGTLLLAGIIGIERLSKYKIMGAASAFIGALIVVTHGQLELILDQQWNIGDLLMVLSAIIWAIWGVAVTFKPKGLSIISFLTTLIAIGVLFLLPFYIWEATYVAPTPLHLEALSIYLYVGVFASVVAWFMWQHSIETIGTIKTSLIYYSIPLFSGILSIWILDEPIEAYHIYGFIMIFTGIIISNLRKMGLVKNIAS